MIIKDEYIDSSSEHFKIRNIFSIGRRIYFQVAMR